MQNKIILGITHRGKPVRIKISRKATDNYNYYMFIIPHDILSDGLFENIYEHIVDTVKKYIDRVYEENFSTDFVNGDIGTIVTEDRY